MTDTNIEESREILQEEIHAISSSYSFFFVIEKSQAIQFKSDPFLLIRLLPIYIFNYFRLTYFYILSLLSKLYREKLYELKHYRISGTYELDTVNGSIKIEYSNEKISYSLIFYSITQIQKEHIEEIVFNAINNIKKMGNNINYIDWYLDSFNKRLFTLLQ